MVTCIWFTQILSAMSCKMCRHPCSKLSRLPTSGDKMDAWLICTSINTMAQHYCLSRTSWNAIWTALTITSLPDWTDSFSTPFKTLPPQSALTIFNSVSLPDSLIQVLWQWRLPWIKPPDIPFIFRPPYLMNPTLKYLLTMATGLTSPAPLKTTPP